jgi:predicted Zn-dependent protease
MVGKVIVAQTPAQTAETAIALFAAGNRAAAGRLCEQGLREVPAGAEALVLEGILLTVDGRVNDAMCAFDKALSLAPTLLAAHLAIAQTLAEKQWHHSALAVMEAACQTAPMTAEAERLFARVREHLEGTRGTAGNTP